MKRSISLIVGISILGSSFTGCETTGQTTMLGAGTGAAVAAATSNSPLGGAAIGAGAGFLAGRLIARERRLEYERRGYPVAHRSRPGFVISPYRPYYEIDVRGFPRGARVVDPSNNRVFINP